MYIDAKKDLAVLKTNRLIERVENDQLHLEIINASLHFDEFLKEGSPHAHIIFVPYADGYPLCRCSGGRNDRRHFHKT